MIIRVPLLATFFSSLSYTEDPHGEISERQNLSFIRLIKSGSVWENVIINRVVSMDSSSVCVLFLICPLGGLTLQALFLHPGKEGKLLSGLL